MKEQRDLDGSGKWCANREVWTRRVAGLMNQLDTLQRVHCLVEGVMDMRGFIDPSGI